MKKWEAYTKIWRDAIRDKKPDDFVLCALYHLLGTLLLGVLVWANPWIVVAPVGVVVGLQLLKGLHGWLHRRVER